MRFRDLSIKTKTAMRMVITSSLLCILLVFFLGLTKKIDSSAHHSRDESLKFALLAKEAQMHVIQTQQWLTDISATRGAAGFDDGYANADKHAKGFRLVLSQFHEMFVAENNQEMISFIGKLQMDFEEYYRVGKEMARVYIQQGSDAGNKYMEKFDPYAAKINEEISTLVADEVDELTTSMDQIIENVSLLLTYFFAGVVVIMTVNVVLGTLISRSITQPLYELLAVAQKISAGDISERIEIDRKDEMGVLGSSFVKMSQTIRKTFVQCREQGVIVEFAAATMDKQSLEMTKTSTELKESSSGITKAADTVTESLETASSSIENLASDTETMSTSAQEMSENVNTVAAATEELTASIQEVAVNCSKAHTVASEALEKSEDSSQKINELEKASNEIGRVVDVITEITEQTKLLALNATIEAARAGEAGKGFAVVANEVKDLALQTANATSDIVKRIQEIQSRSTSAVESIQTISSMNRKVNDINSTIAAAVEEQSATIQEVARSMVEVASNATNVSSTVQNLSAEMNTKIVPAIRESSSQLQDVRTNIKEIDEEVEENSVSIAELNANAADLKKTSETLIEITQVFDIGPERFNIGNVKGAHLGWKTKLEGVLQRGAKLDPQDVPDHHSCAFGQWFYSDGASLKDDPAYNDVEKIHKTVHELAIKVATYAHEGKEEESKREMERFEEARVNLFSALDRLYWGDDI